MTPNDYVTAENQKLIGWKRRTAALPDPARKPGIYIAEKRQPTRPLDICLPREYAALNLLPEVRSGALALFAELNIPWHDGVDHGPSNHLRDSQVQCVNALEPMVHDPDRVRAAFGHLLDVCEVTQIEPGRYLTFEYIGPADYFGEGQGRPRRRGTKCTSVDAAFSYRTSKGAPELALIEWKYTESYPAPRRTDPRADATRRLRYQAGAADPQGPINGSVVPFDYLLNEPFYQLTRQQLLVHHLGNDVKVEADVVRVLHVLSPHTLAYQACLHDFAGCELGSTVDEVWAALLPQPDRFVHVDPATLWRASITSTGYASRYGDLPDQQPPEKERV